MTSGGDSNFITMALKDFESVDIRVIDHGIVKYLPISLGKYLVLQASLQFQESSLASLAKNLIKTVLESFKHL